MCELKSDLGNSLTDFIAVDIFPDGSALLAAGSGLSELLLTLLL